MYRIFESKQLSPWLIFNMARVPCDNCGATFSSVSNLNRHARSAHRRIPRKMRCPAEAKDGVKDYSGVRKNWTKKQMETGLGARCSAEYARPDKLAEHLHMHLPLEDRKTFACSWRRCNKKFTRASNLRRHVKSVHGKIKPFLCHLCGKQFTREAGLNSHVVREHWGLLISHIVPFLGHTTISQEKYLLAVILSFFFTYIPLDLVLNIGLSERQISTFDISQTICT